MAVSLNKSVYYTAPASFLRGLTSTGNVMAGDAAFEYYNDKNPEDYVQIPWEEIDHVSASVLFGGRLIPRFAIVTRSAGHFTFSARNNHECLRAIREHVDPSRMLKSPTFVDVFKQGLSVIAHKLFGRK